MSTDPDLEAWCERWLGALPVAELFRSRKISDVRGLRLADGREVIVKTRDRAERIYACAQVQKHLWAAGFPCAEVLVDPAPLGTRLATAESYVGGGTALRRGVENARRYAEELAHAVSLSPDPASVGTLDPPPYWLQWDHSLAGTWPPDPDVDLSSTQGPQGIDKAGSRARRRILRARDVAPVIGHGDWESQNLRWSGDTLLVAHDWDSAVALPEAAIAGVSSLMFPSTGTTNEPATLNESEAFLDAYQSARQRAFDPEEVELAWAASVWIGAWKAKKASLYGDTGVVLEGFRGQMEERLRRARA